MKRKTLGFALLLFANLFAVPDAVFFYIGLLMGLVGLCLVSSGMMSGGGNRKRAAYCEIGRDVRC